MQAPLLVARLPLRTKLTLAYSVVLALMLGVIGLFLYFHFASGLDGALNRTLRTRADDVSALLRADGLRGLTRRRTLVAKSDLSAQVLSPTGRVLFSSSGADAPALLKPTEVRRASALAHYIDEREDQRLLVRRTADRGAILVVSASLEQHEQALQLLRGALVFGGGLALLVAALAGYGLAAAVLRPMETMREAAAQISDIDPDARLPLPLATDEVHRLGRTLNDMLGRVQSARERERAFVSNASHELRTPLAILKTEVEVALRTDNPPETLREALQIAGVEADRLMQLAEDLLIVARSDAGRLDLDRRTVSTRRILESIERRFRIRARESGRAIAIDERDDHRLLADVTRLEQALSNLVDNALRYGQGTITLRALRNPDRHIELHVLDEGPGLPTSFLPHALERFSRAQPGRTEQGAGLGLAIVELIAAAHGGHAGVANRTDAAGADAWLRLPAA